VIASLKLMTGIAIQSIVRIIPLYVPEPDE
jgi:hypothetical protein